MILQILAHLGRIDFNRNAMLLQQMPGTDAGQLQYLRRADASRTEKYKIRKMRGCTGFPQKVTASDAMTQRL